MARRCLRKAGRFTLSFKDAGFLSSQCVRADVGPMLNELARSLRIAEKGNRAFHALKGEFWFGAMAKIRSEERCVGYRRSLESFKNLPDIAADRLIVGQLSLAKLDRCMVASNEVDIGGALAHVGIKISTPPQWKSRLAKLAEKDPIVAIKEVAVILNERGAVTKNVTTSAILKGGESTLSPNSPALTTAVPKRTPAPAMEAVNPPTPPVNSIDSQAMDCAADAADPRSPEDALVVANGRRFLTGQALRMGSGGAFYVVEAALGFDGSCRPDPYQIYVYYDGKQVGTLSPRAMSPRTTGAILSFSAKDQQHVEIQIARYRPDDPTCCPSNIDKNSVALSKFIKN